jgi:NAD(P)-dependent dehydrogenase (short-subunit alcohol dehydrogenase family)
MQVDLSGLRALRDQGCLRDSDEDWLRMFETNMLSGVRFTRHYGPRMRDKGFGRIIFISSESGVQIPTEMIHYGFSKSADLALMRALAATGVTVSAVLPGPTRTKGVENRRRLVRGSSPPSPATQKLSVCFCLVFNARG